MDQEDLKAAEAGARSAGDTDDPARAVHEFVRALLGRYEGLCAAEATPPPDAHVTDQRLSELLLAEAVLRHGRAAEGDGARRPRQIAVLGPTQTGKSTIVNLILGTPVADVSPLAGFTIHPQGFWVGGDRHDEDWVVDLFPGWQRCDAGTLGRDQAHLERYALGALPDGAQPPAGLPACVVWDTPDFDSLAAQTYRRGVLEVAALADVHLLVLSKEKYADLSVWRMLRLLGALARPLIICLNKLTPEAIEPVVASLSERLADTGGRIAAAPVVVFEYRTALDVTADLGALPEVWELRDRIAEEVGRNDRNGRAEGVRALVRRHWADWTKPIAIEHAALRAFDERIDTLLDEALASYRRDFLDHPQRFDTFHRATVELLHLLEVPGIAHVLSPVRHVLSWPARRLFAARQAWSARRHRDAGVPHGAGSEAVVLQQIVEKLLIGLERDAARRCDTKAPGHAVWRAIAQCIERREAELRTSFHAAAEQQRADFAPVIQATANQLFEALQKRPMVLNALRAARTTTDVAAIAVAIKTGGLGINDVLFAPAMFGLVSMLTEGALGTYMKHVAEELKKKQFEHVEANLIRGVFAKRLHELTADLKGEGLFGFSPDELRRADEAREAWERGGDA